jgi:hypothetical protein
MLMIDMIPSVHLDPTDSRSFGRLSERTAPPMPPATIRQYLPEYGA